MTRAAGAALNRSDGPYPFASSRALGEGDRRMARDWLLVGRPHAKTIVEIASEVQNTLTVLSPFVSEKAVTELLNAFPSDRRVAVRLVTAADPRSILHGSCQLRALRMVAEHEGGGDVYRLHRLHAKVYLADASAGLVTSANLTDGGFRGNYEYGIVVRDAETVAGIRKDVLDYVKIATPLGVSALRELEALVDAAPPPRPEPAVEHAVHAVEDVLVREHVTGRSENEVFANSILFILQREGPLSTEDLHPHVKALHPELCDDTRERIIDGRSFGKRWKHQVRNAQQYLKRKGLIQLDNGLWALAEGAE